MNDGYTYTETIGRRAQGKRLDAYLAGRYGHSTLDEWRAHIVAGRVQLDGKTVGTGHTLELGQVLDWHRPPWDEPDAPLDVDLLYEDAYILVAHKPSGLPTMPGGGFLQNTLVHQLRLDHGDAAPMHRLGRFTSGAVVCSRTREAGAHLAAQFVNRTVDKRYRALCSGLPSLDHFEVRTPIGPVPYAPLGTLHAANPAGRHAKSTVTVIERRASSALCDVVIATGRPHQIRIHLAAAGHPLVGDPLYASGGLPEPGCTALPGDPGYHLHAAEIGFDHPDTGLRMVIEAQPPALLKRT